MQILSSALRMYDIVEKGVTVVEGLESRLSCVVSALPSLLSLFLVVRLACRVFVLCCRVVVLSCLIWSGLVWSGLVWSGLVLSYLI